jgi:acyl-[acyl-carrier-protein]-phospholipid O-acyltransferase/long-chain-fatty-acid--[acyl-carrier-protein] ligase
MQRSLLVQRRFGPLFVSQFFSAFNDNYLKNSLVFLILYKMSGPDAEALVTLAGAAIVAPFFVLSGLAGQLADRFDKSLIARRLRAAEIVVAAVAVAGFAWHALPLLFVALAGFGVISALFGPVKYGILPDHLDETELARGNALVEGATFIAILAGTLAGSLVSQGGGDPTLFAAGLLVVALAAWAAATFIPPTGERAPTLKIDPNVLRSTAALVGDLRSDRRLWRLGIIVSIFWLIGAVALSLLPVLVKVVLGGSELVVSAYLALFAVAVAVGSGLGAYLSFGRTVLVMVPVASVVMAAAAAHLGWTLIGVTPAPALLDVAAFFERPIAWRVAVDLGLVALAGGLYVVPPFAALQHWAPIERRARVVAGVNVVTAAFMTVAGLGVAGLQAAGVPMAALFGLVAVVALVAAVWIAATLPTDPVRDLAIMALGLLFRLEVRGREHIEAVGERAVVVANHVSFLDAIIVYAVLDRPPMFAIDREIATRWWVKPVLRVVRTCAVEPAKPMAARLLIEEARAGATLAIFPEGRITVTGGLMKIYDGAAMVADKAGVPLLVLHIDGAEATPFARLKSDQVRRRWFPKIRVTAAAPTRLALPESLRGKARRRAAGAALADLLSDLAFRAADRGLTVPEALIRAMRRAGPGRTMLRDPVAGDLSGRRMLVAARALGGWFAAETRPGEAVGVLLPTANAAALTIFGLMSAGRVPAMLNFTAGPAQVAAAAAVAEVRLVVTARAFVERARLGGLVEALAATVRVVYLEDVRAAIGTADKLRARLLWRRPLARSAPDAPAAILFTSGTEGAPKGVVLSHRNMLTNVAQVAARIDFGGRDRVLNVLPLFHALGLVSATVLPLVSGVPVYLYPSPLHYRTVAELAYAIDATVLFGTDTFLAGYARVAHPYDFRALRLLVAGAEAVKEATRRRYMELFGVRILEGYGVTEAAPVLALNTPMASRSGSVGRLLPGIEARIEPVVGLAEGGRLHVRGANIMLGYLRAGAPGVIEPPPDGWHDTGDVVTIDGDGFVTILGRARRFAKIGGEMVSLAAAEALAATCRPEVPAAAVALPDPRRGERIVLVTMAGGADRAELAAAARRAGLSELTVPSELLVVATLPLLGSGKVDLIAVAEMARAALAPANPAV